MIYAIDLPDSLSKRQADGLINHINLMAQHVAECNYNGQHPLLIAARLPGDLNYDTAEMLTLFIKALGVKLRAKQDEKGSTWKQDDWRESCQAQLQKCVVDGDPIDVAAFAAFCWHHGWATSDMGVAHDGS